MALMYVPRQQSRQGQMFSLLTNLMMQKIGHKQRMEVVDQQTKSATALFNAKTAQEKLELEEKRLYTEGRDAKKKESDLLLAGYTPAPPKIGTMLPGMAGMNVPDSDEVIKDPITGKRYVKPKVEWEKKQVAIDGKKYDVWTNGKGGIRFASGPSRSTTNVNIDMTKKTQGTLEGDVLKATGSIAMADRLMKAAKPEYFEVPNQVMMAVSKKLERGGIAKWKTKEQAKYYTFWKMTRQESLKERKFFTGVAGGEKEMADIEATTPNMGDSYSTFISTLENRKVLDKALRNRALVWLDKGVDLRKLTPEARAKLVEDDPLDNYGWYGPEGAPSKNGGEYGPIERDISEGKYIPGRPYEDAEGNVMVFDGYDKQGTPIWSEP